MEKVDTDCVASRTDAHRQTATNRSRYRILDLNFVWLVIIRMISFYFPGVLAYSWNTLGDIASSKQQVQCGQCEIWEWFDQTAALRLWSLEGRSNTASCIYPEHQFKVRLTALLHVENLPHPIRGAEIMINHEILSVNSQVCAARGI